MANPTLKAIKVISNAFGMTMIEHPGRDIAAVIGAG
jgi:hypothetical protein